MDNEDRNQREEKTGMPPREMILREILDAARRRLETGRSSVTGVALDLGFSSNQYFATVFKRYTGQRPCEVQPKGRGHSA